MKFTSAFYKEFYSILKEVFSNEWPDKTAPNSDLKVWQITGEESVNTYKYPLSPVTEQLLKVNDRYYYQRYRKALNSDKIIIVKDDKAIIAFQYIGCKGKNLVTLQDYFIEKYQILQHISNPQKKLNEKNAKILNTDHSFVGNFRKESSLTPTDYISAIKEKCHRYLANTDWWFYIYGYESANDLDYKDRDWLLLRLFLSFGSTEKRQLVVTLDNLDDDDDAYVSFDYEGFTDFMHSSNTVLSIRLYSDPGHTRTLVVNVNIGNGSGNLFMGQYLNYDELGYITSGTVILEKFDSKKHEDPMPEGFLISRAASTIDDYPQEVGHIAYLLQNRQLNFRRTPIGINNLKALENWQKKRRKENS